SPVEIALPARRQTIALVARLAASSYQPGDDLSIEASGGLRGTCVDSAIVGDLRLELLGRLACPRGQCLRRIEGRGAGIHCQALAGKRGRPVLGFGQRHEQRFVAVAVTVARLATP